MEILVEHAGAGAGEEETTGAAAVAWTPPITSPHVLLKSHHRRGVDGDEAGFSELRVSHGDERPTQVYVLVVEGQRLDDGVVKFVNNDHCLLGERVALPLMSMVRPELSLLPLAQVVWYIPTGLDPWNQLLGKAPGHYTRLYEIKVDQAPPKPEAHWPDQEPLR